MSRATSAEGQFEIESDQAVYFPKRILGNDSYVFAACKKNINLSGINCKIHWVRLRPENTVELLKTCLFQKAPSGITNFLYKLHPLSLDLLGDDRTIIISWITWNDKVTMKQRVSIVNMSNCNTKDLQFTSSDKYLENLTLGNIVPYSTQFDIFTSDKKCGSWNKCILSYDDSGLLKHKSRFNISAAHFNVFPISRLSSEKGFVAYTESKSTNHNSTSLAVYFRSPSAETMVPLGEYWYGITDSPPITSNANLMFTICEKQMMMSGGMQNSLIHCIQLGKESANYTSDFKKIFSESFNGLKAGAVFNFRQGGFLMLILDCDGYLEPSCKTFTLYKVKQSVSMSSHHKMTTLHKGLSNVACSGELHDLKIIANETDDKYCFHILCASELMVGGDILKKLVYFKKLCFFKLLIALGVPT
ncbi:hypothetical protein QAD02_016997 [Eretmocerus hayati]|uniref:Uncharacterized protein n=1 Tax=Eretmocerus hayati TaxID=131215 RepID=A0ACC2PHG8_9HYME|nr:hypothetical protein QAD02_016997 [Eretmocerus hayati]